MRKIDVINFEYARSMFFRDYIYFKPWVFSRNSFLQRIGLLGICELFFRNRGQFLQGKFE
jgi:hypothetical protein